MKRLLCFIFSVLMLLSVFTVFASAESISEPSVMQELAQLQIDGVPFSQLMDTKYPINKNDENLYVITCVEKAFTDVQSVAGFEMYFYIYNPSCIDIQDNMMNSIQIGIGENCSNMNYYALKKYSVSSDKRFIKMGLTNNNLFGSYYSLCTRQEDMNRRVYNVVQLRLFTANGVITPTVSKVFFFEGFDYANTLKSYWKQMDVLEVELHTTNWISPNAGLRVDGTTETTVYDHYEIHTVYFRVPREYWETYEFLYSIRATYDRVHLTPIILTHQNDRDFSDEEGQATKEAILKGTSLSGSPSLEVYDLGWTEQIINSLFGHRHVYSDSEAVHNRADEVSNVIGEVPGLATHYDALAYYFATLDDSFEYTDGASLQKAAVSSSQLKEYFYERYNNPHYSNSLLYSEYISKQNLDLDGTQFFADGIYAMKDFQEILDTKSDWEQWWTKWVTEDDSPLYDRFADEVEHISVVKNPSAYASESAAAVAADALFIHETDAKEFSKVCSEAVAEGDYVVLLRLGFNDYYCAPVQDNYEVWGGFGSGPYVACAVDKWVYLNINVAELIFSKNGELHSVPVSSNTVDSFGNVDASGDPMINGPSDIIDEIGDRFNLDGLWEDVMGFLLWIGVALAVFVVLMIVVRLLRKKEKKESVTINLIDPGSGGGGGSFWRRRRKREK